MRPVADKHHADRALTWSCAEKGEATVAIGARLPIDAIRLQRDERVLNGTAGLVSHDAAQRARAVLRDTDRWKNREYQSNCHKRSHVWPPEADAAVTLHTAKGSDFGLQASGQGKDLGS